MLKKLHLKRWEDPLDTKHSLYQMSLVIMPVVVGGRGGGGGGGKEGPLG